MIKPYYIDDSIVDLTKITAAWTMSRAEERKAGWFSTETITLYKYHILCDGVILNVDTKEEYDRLIAELGDINEKDD